MSRRTNRSSKPPAKKSPWRAIVVAACALAVAGTVVGSLAARRHPAAPGAAGAAQAARVTSLLAGVPSALLRAVGTRGAAPPVAVHLPGDQQKLAPTVLYIGAEWCPYCAAERWPLVLALSRFGTFHHLGLTTSSATDVYPKTPTLSFYGARYDSPYVRLEAVELQGNTPDASGNYPTLQTPTRAQQTLFAELDAPPYVPAGEQGSIPFVLVGGRYLWAGASYSPELLHGLTWIQIAQQIRQGRTPAARAILANADELVGAICRSDGMRPAAVCQPGRAAGEAKSS